MATLAPMAFGQTDPEQESGDPSEVSEVQRLMNSQGNPADAAEIQRLMNSRDNPANAAEVQRLMNRQGDPADAAEIQRLMNSRGNPADAAEIQRLMNDRGGVAQSMIAHFPFDEHANDVSGNYEPIDGLAIKEILQGRHGGALRFDGETVIEIPVDLSADVMPEFTVSMWLKIDRPPTDAKALQSYPNSVYVASNLLVITDLKSATPSFYNSVPGGRSSADGRHRVRPGQWVHVAVTRRIEKRANTAGDSTPHIVTELHSEGRVTESASPYREERHLPSIYLGSASPKVRPDSFVGLIDDLRVYRSAMGAKQIVQLKSASEPQQFPDN